MKLITRILDPNPMTVSNCSLIAMFTSDSDFGFGFYISHGKGVNEENFLLITALNDLHWITLILRKQEMFLLYVSVEMY